MKRHCDACGKEKELQGGKTCEKGHFICKSCVTTHYGVFGNDTRSKCPVCSKPLK